MEECKGMAGRGHVVELAGCPHGRLRENAEKAGLVFHPIDMRGAWDIKALLQLARLIRTRKFQIINTHSSVDSWLGGYAGRLTGCKIVRTRHLSVPVNTHPLNFVYRLPHAVTTTGEGIRNHLVNDYGLKPDRVFSIPTGIDPELYKPGPPDPALREELGLKAGETVIAIIAVLRNWKRQDLFCYMAQDLLTRRQDLRFLIVGDGPWKVPGELVKELKLEPSLIMTGHRQDVARILNVCNICVLASDEAEGVPQAILQQMASEKAVVASNAGDVGQVVRNEQTGLLVETGSWQALAKAVERLLQDPELGRRLGQNGRQMVLTEYSLSHMLDGTEKVYSIITGG